MRKQRCVGYGIVFVMLLLLAGCKPTVRITFPPNGSTYDFGAAITFSGTGSDFNDGDLTGSALVWTSNRDGQIGTGETFTKSDLSSGVHTITLTATNSKSQTRTATVTITVGEPSVVEITEDIDSNTTWESENIYLVKEVIFVNAILTIEAGTVIKLEDGVYVEVVDGKIIAQGAAGSPIIFTSYRDDVYGGDTNGDGSATAPAAGDWDYVSIDGTNNASVFTYCEFYYGGGYEGYDYTLYLGSETVGTVSNCTFVHNAGEEEGVLNAANAGTGTTITGNVFYDNIKPISISGEIDIDDSNVFHNPASASEINTKNGIYFVGSFGYIEGNRSWEETEVPFVICDTYNMRIETGASLTLGANVLLKLCEGSSIESTGGLIIAQGTVGSPIIFTSYRDDVYGGDTNGDGSATAPAAGDWDYVSIDGTNNASVFTYCEFYYGGGYEGYDYTLYLGSETIATVSNCTFVHNAGEEEGVLNAANAGTGTTITGNVFYDNIKPISISGEIDIDDSNVFHNPASASEINTKNGIYYLGAFGDIIGNRSWEETEVPFVIADNTYDLQIPAGASLTLGNNVILKFDSGQYLTYEGNNLVNYNGSGVWFTSYRNDARLGDTNGDGSITTPAAGDWDGIWNNPLSSYEAWPNIEYAAN